MMNEVFMLCTHNFSSSQVGALSSPTCCMAAVPKGLKLWLLQQVAQFEFGINLSRTI